MTTKLKYKITYPDMLIEHMKKGYSFKSFGASPVCANEMTLNRWLARYPAFLEAKSYAEIECLKFWERIGIRGTTGKIKNFSPPTFIFNMKNRFKWSDRTDLHVTSHEKVEDKDKHEQLKSIDRKQLIQLVKKVS